MVLLHCICEYTYTQSYTKPPDVVVLITISLAKTLATVVAEETRVIFVNSQLHYVPMYGMHHTEWRQLNRMIMVTHTVYAIVDFPQNLFYHFF